MYNVDQALESLSSERFSTELVFEEELSSSEWLRSPAAFRVAKLARKHNCRLYHYERRAHLSDPWISEEHPAWSNGVLEEPKYGSFQHDLPIGSFHPGHRGKWTTHEWCHTLIGYSWAPNRSVLYHSMAARISELVPVWLYYFADEVGLHRCEEHQGAGALFRKYCVQCEEVAAHRAVNKEDRAWLEQGKVFLEREVQAIESTIRTSRLHTHHLGSLNLTTDALAYGRAHGPRLQSDEFSAYQERYAVKHERSDTLEELLQRALCVVQAVVGGELFSYSPLGDAEQHRQDLASRALFATKTLTDGPNFDDLIEDFEGTIRNLEELGFEISSTGTVLGKSSLTSMEQGLVSVAPTTLEAAEDAGVDLVEQFVSQDGWSRRSLGERFVGFLPSVADAVVTQLASYEVALRKASVDGFAALQPADSPPDRLCEGVMVVRGPADVVELQVAVDSGECEGEVVNGRLVLPNFEPSVGALIIGRAHDELEMVVVPEDSVEGVRVVDEEVAWALKELGLAKSDSIQWQHRLD